eukprot:CAMPEP_0185279118 /NCGR_PEP_ID=MMETSP1359-20130426/62744_1 /TAXON_ID=552665 /ORGANISM="Bigelowiella longifila, Strain CCMP242" /LENGTH=275 /DNA_ID=CAMNT_0027873889 /DNA_START=360 /DNA_END=1188 /DNA_ORIENTATION=-
MGFKIPLFRYGFGCCCFHDFPLRGPHYKQPNLASLPPTSDSNRLLHYRLLLSLFNVAALSSDKVTAATTYPPLFEEESKTAGSQLDHHPKSSRNNNITIAVSSSNLYNNENSANTISPRVASPHVTNQRSFPHSTPRYAPRQSLKHTSVNSEARQATSCNGAGGINTSQTTLRATSDNRKSDAAMLRKSKISAQSRARAVVEQRVLRKICVMRTIGFILIAPLTLLFASFALFFLQTEETREETWEENRNSYDVITDVLYYIMLFCNGYAIFYNH